MQAVHMLNAFPSERQGPCGAPLNSLRQGMPAGCAPHAP